MKSSILFFIFYFWSCLILAATDNPNALSDKSQTPPLTLSQQEYAFIQSHPIIRVGNEMDWPPFDYNEYGKPKGYVIDFIKLIAQKVGVELEFVYNKSWDELIGLLKAKKIDVLPVMYKNQEREKFTLFSQPYYRGKLGVFSNDQSNSINSVRDLIGHRVGVEKSNGALPIIHKQFPLLELIEIENNQQLVRNLATHKLDAIIGNPLLFSYYAKEDQITNIKIIDYFNLSKEEQDKTSFHIGVRNDWAVFHNIIVKAMNSLTVEELQEIENRWIDIPNRIRRGLIKLTDKEKEYIHNHQKIRVSNELDFPPFDFAIASQPQGYSIDLVKLLAERIGIEVEFINGFTWNQLLNKFKNKQLDVIHTAAITPERERYSLYSDSYYQNRNHFIVPKSAVDITQVKELYGKIVAVGKGWAQEEYLSLNHPKIKLLTVNNMQELLEAVSTGQADAGLESMGATNYMLRKQNFTDLKISGWFKEYDTNRDNGYHFMLQKDAPELLSMFNKALASLTPGDLDNLERKWFGDSKITDQTISLTIKEQNYLTQKQTIKLCIDPNWLPYERLNKKGKHEGIGAEIITLISKRIKTPIELQATKNWGISLKYIQQRKCDMLTLAMDTPNRRKSMDFTSPYITQPLVIVTKSDELFISDINDIGRREIAITKDYAFIEILKQQFPDLKIIEVDSIHDGLKSVQDGEIFGYVGSLPTIAYTMQRESFFDLKIAGKLERNMKLSMASRNDEPLLNSILEKALNSISENEKKTIINRWYSFKFEPGMDYRLFWNIITIALIILLLILYWNRKIAKAKFQTQQALDELQIAKKELEVLAITDHLTGLYNRSELDQILSYEISRAKRFQSFFAVILLDVDYFKKVNDTHGHQVGDKVLKQIATLLQTNSREIDTVGRWGGEEFLIICPETNQAGAQKLAEHLRKKISQSAFDITDSQTASFGVTSYQSDDQEQDIVARADQALYKAKRNGRNRVELG